MRETLDWLTGVDEVGRGALLGDVVAAAVTLTPEAAITLQAQGVRDSKQLSAKQREALVPMIRAAAITWGLGRASAAEIDQINILQATFLAMRRAIASLDPAPGHCWVDGNRPIPGLGMLQTTLVKGDQHNVAIASASIIAKVDRDQQMIELAARYPGYQLERNKGYGSAAHRLAIATLGITPEHRRSFAPCQLRLLD